ncbi:MAG: 3-oxoacyl-ACP reductase FabG [Bdellovibrionales bacterium]
MATKHILFNFSGRSAVVTGAAQGIGFAITQKLLEAGTNVSIWDRSSEQVKLAQTELRNFGSRLHVRVVDITDRNQCLTSAQSLPWQPEILVNNAGITRDRTFAKMADEEFDSVIAVNLTGIYNVTKALLPTFAESAHKRIVNMSSLVGLLGNFGQVNYAASKAALIGMTKSLARELGPKGFTVNAVAPGFIKTPMTAKMPKEILDSIEKRVPVGRLGEPEDVANLCLFLCAEESSYINGSVTCVDGGLVI